MSNTSNHSELTKPHDLLVKATLSNPQALRDFANIYLPQQVVEKMDQNSLQLTNKSYVSPDMKEFHNDFVFSFSLKSYPGYAFCMVEHVRHDGTHIKSIYHMARLYPNLRSHYLGASLATMGC
jgi:predicted transposase YdaD